MMGMGKASEWLQGLKEFWGEYRRYKSGIMGLVLLILLAGMALGAPLIAPKETYENWYNPAYWTDYPQEVPPVWVSYLSGVKKAPHVVMEKGPGDATVLPSAGNTTYVVEFTYSFRYDEPPNDILLRVMGRASEEEKAYVSIKVRRPDGQEIVLLPGYETAFPEIYKGMSSKHFKVGKRSDIGTRIVKWAEKFDTPENVVTASIRPPLGGWVIRILFSKAEEGILVGDAELLKGDYVFTITVVVPKGGELWGTMMIFYGTAYGLLGTDSYGRDLLAGIVWGARLALLIGIMTSLISTIVGVLYGVVSAYLGGLVDEGMMRIYEIVSSIPLLPVLLILSWQFGVTIWNLAFIMALFWWTGPVRTVRSMALQIKEETYVEAARAIGVGTRRMIMKYIANQILPYAFALMALGVPGAILTEAGVSFLLGGRGVREPTWGKILHDAHKAAATMKGLWWWVLAPGLMICITGLTFVLIGNALDRILNPMLRR